MKANPSSSYLRWLMVAPLGVLLAISSALAQGAAPAATPSEEVVKMSPFQVQASTHDVGYYAENTLAGSRLNTNVGDLASSITVVTKQQLLDTASVDINDVFMYEANTEGANTYTPYFLNRSTPRDSIGGFSTDQGPGLDRAFANRIRGLDASDVAINNYPASNRIPFDTYNTNSVEINRGPNSLLFGTGSSAGITNQSTAGAVLGQRKTEIVGQLSRWSGYRVSINHNQPLGDKFAIYVAALYAHNTFERKPSYDNSRRQYGALTYQPFKGTRITASFENLSENSHLPNYLTPRDGITPWLQAGRPVWNPITQMITFLDNNSSYGPYLTATNDTRYPGAIAAYPALSQALPTTSRITIGNTWLSTLSSPLYVPGIQFRSAHAYMLVNQGSLLGFWQGQPSAVGNPPFSTGIPAAASRTQAQWVLAANRPTFSALPQAPVLANGTAKYATWIIPGVTNKSIYDYESVNFGSINWAMKGAKTYNVELQQEVMNSDRWGSLNFELGWFRQEIQESDFYPLGQTNQQSTLYADTNVLMPDGTANPWLGSPVEFDYSNDLFRTPENNNNWRVLLAYEKDFTQNKGWTRWLGKHRLMGLFSRQEDNYWTLRYRLSTDAGDTRYLPNSTVAGWSYWNNGLFDHDYYLGQNQTGTVQHSAGYFDPPGWGGIGQANINTYNYTTGAYDAAGIKFDQNYSFAGTTPLATKILEGQSLAWQGHFWDDRIVGTLGWRRDWYRARQTDQSNLQGSQQYPGGYPDVSLINRMNNWFYLNGRTKTAGVVFRPLKWSSGNIGLTLNRSDNFNPPTGSPKDFFMNPLPKPQGKGKDYGIEASLFNNKLVARINWFDSDNQNANAVAAATALGRVTRMDTSSMRSWSEYVVRIRNGEDITANFANNTAHPLTTAELSSIETLMNAPNYSANTNGWPSGFGNATQEDKAKGIEAQVIYNPVPNWNIKFTLGKQKSIYDKVAPELDAWLAQRSGVWTSAVATDLPNELQITTGASGSGATPVLLSNFWNGYGFNADARLSNASSSGWVSPRTFYESAVATEIAVAKALQGQIVPNERLWSWNLMSTYAFTHGRLRGASFGGAVRWIDRAIAGYMGDTAHLNSSGQIAAPDITQPIYTPSETSLDLWAGYTTKIPWIFGDKVQVRFQLNVRDVTEKGGLQAIAFNFDGSPASWRIKDPRQYFFTTTLDF
ncbi:MAG TPA: TonB-dependent receptor plug domain-containing protein [Opitutaceae bacterium]|nr:TonB-dependent receptor plug domain-containing protein [Opitutaceae bacterium]